MQLKKVHNFGSQNVHKLLLQKNLTVKYYIIEPSAVTGLITKSLL